MPTTITASGVIVAVSGIFTLGNVAQTGGATASGTILRFGGFSTTAIAGGYEGVSMSEKRLDFEGVDQTGFVVVASAAETVGRTEFIVFFPDFARSINLYGVIGTSGTVERFFDRSPFYFGDHEADPNTLRDLSEAQQLLVFTQANVFSFDNFRNTSGSAAVISVKGDQFASSSSFTDLISNGSFESGLSGWETYTKHSADIVTTRTSQPTGVGFNDASPVSPPDGSSYLYISKQTTSGTLAIRQNIQFGKVYNSSVLKDFAFKMVPDENTSNRRNLVALRFLLADVSKHLIHYRFGSQGLPDFPTGLGLDDKDTQVSLSSTAGVLNTYVRTISTDTSYSSYNFDEIEVWIISDTADATTTDTLWDSFQFTADIPPTELLRTSSLAHVFTGHPTASGFPFTISGSDDVNQIDTTAPYFDEVSPGSGTTFNPTTSPVSFHVKDLSSAVDQGSINVWIDHVQVVTAGTATSSATWSPVIKTVLAPGDIKYDLTRTSPFQQQAVVGVSGTFSDLATPSNGAYREYSFTILGSGSLNATISGAPDGTGPTFTPTYPTDLATNVSPNANLSWTSADDASGVAPLTVRLYLNGVLQMDNDIGIQGSFSRTTNSSRGFDYVYTPDTPFAFGSTITGTFEGYDNAGNFSTSSYEFVVTAANTLSIINFFLGTGESVLLTTGTIGSVELVDETYGVASGTSYITINGSPPVDLTPVYSGAGPYRIIYYFPLQPEVNFREDLEILVHAENLFPGPYPVVKEETYTLRPGYDVNWYNKTPDAVGGPETTFPYITNIQVLTEVKNYANRYGQGSEFFRFLTEEQAKANLGAYLESNIKTADLSAVLVSLNPYFEYGKTITLDLEVTDLEGNQLQFTHTFTIESDPSP